MRFIPHFNGVLGTLLTGVALLAAFRSDPDRLVVGLPTVQIEATLQTGTEDKDHWSAKTISISHDGAFLASGGRVFPKNQLDAFLRPRGCIRIWDLSSKKIVRSLEGVSGSIQSLAFSRDGKTLAYAGGEIWEKRPGTLRVVDATTGKVIRVFDPEIGQARAVVFSADGKNLAACGAETSQRPPNSGDWVHGWLRVWSLDTGRELWHHEWEHGAFNALAFSPDGRSVAVGGAPSTMADGEVRIFSVEDGKRRFTFKRHTYWVTAVAFNPDSRTVASGEASGAVFVWDAGSGRELGRFSPGENPAKVIKDNQFSDELMVNDISFAPDGKSIAVARGRSWRSRSRGDLLLWDLKTNGSTIAILNKHPERMTSVTFSPDGRHLAAGDEQGLLRLWRIVPE